MKVFSTFIGIWFNIPLEYWYRFSAIFLGEIFKSSPYFLVPTSLIQCAKNLLAGIIFESMLFASTVFFEILMRKQIWMLFQITYYFVVTLLLNLRIWKSLCAESAGFVFAFTAQILPCYASGSISGRSFIRSTALTPLFKSLCSLHFFFFAVVTRIYQIIYWFYFLIIASWINCLSKMNFVIESPLCLFYICLYDLWK